MVGTEGLYRHVSADGLPYSTKREYKEWWRKSWAAGEGPDLMDGETFDQWFEVLMAALIEDGSARKVGNHYEIYEG